MTKPALKHSPEQQFLTIFCYVVVISFLHYALFSLKICFTISGLALLLYAHLLGLFARKRHKTIDLRQAIADIQQGKLNTYQFDMVRLNIYLIAPVILALPLWIGFYYSYGFILPLLQGKRAFYDVSIASWLFVVLFIIFIYVCFNKIRTMTKQKPNVQRFYLTIDENSIHIGHSAGKTIAWKNVTDIYRTSTKNVYGICILYKEHDQLYEELIYDSEIRVGKQRKYLEEFLQSYWLTTTGKEIITIK